MKKLCVVAVLVCGPLLVLWPFLDAGLVSDDIFFADLYRMGSWRETLLGPWPHSMGVTDGWRPVVLLTYALNAATTDGSPGSYRLFNVVVHGVCSALLAGIVTRLHGGRGYTAGLVAGALFAVHPLVHENVVWISGRTYPVAAMFGLALCLWTLAAEQRPAWQRHAGAVLLLTLALASYEFAVVLPILVTAVVFVQRLGRGYRSSLTNALVVTWPLFVTLAAYLAFRWIWLTDVTSDIIVTARASQWAPAVGPLHERVLRNTLFFALKLLAWPWFERGSEITWNATALLTGLLAVAALMRLGLHPQGRAHAGLWVFWIVVCFLPVVGYSGFADRFGYLSVAGLAGLFASATTVVVSEDRKAVSRTWTIALAVLLVAWAAALRERARDWVDAGQLAAQVVAATLAVEPGPIAPVDLHFVGVPERQRSALVLITYFPQAVWKHYDAEARRHVTFHMSWEPVSRVLERLDQAVPQRDVRAYEWRPDNMVMVRVL